MCGTGTSVPAKVKVEPLSLPSRFRLLRLARGLRAAACLLAALALPLGVGTAQAQTPGYSSASVSGRLVTVTLTGNRGGCPALQAWTVNIDGTDFTPSSLHCKTSSVLLWLSSRYAPQRAQTYKVSYDKTKAVKTFSTGAIQGSTLTIGGTEVASFTDRAVTNPNPVPRF